jgi:hypothetical protein
MDWKTLKNNLLNLNVNNSPVLIEMPPGVIIDEKKFINSHIAVVEKYPQTNPPTHANNKARANIAKPHYDRLLRYYLIKTEL